MALNYKCEINDKQACLSSDSGEDEKVKGTRKVGPCSPQFPFVLFSSSRFLNSVGPTISDISEPGTGYPS